MRVEAPQIAQAHALYCQLTGQKLRLDFGRERAWYELLRAGFTLAEVRRVILYLQREIREGRRNVGALKLSNLLQPDRFEEDLNIRAVRLEPPPTRPTHAAPGDPLSEEEKEQGRRRALAQLSQLKQSLGAITSHPEGAGSTDHPATSEPSSTAYLEHGSTE